MSSSTKQLFFLLFTLLSCSLNIQARDPQFFNKMPATTATNYLPNDQQPDFVPDNEDSYGLYGHESGQFPPSATLSTDSATTTTTTAYNSESEQPLNKHLPKNYNPVAYVTEPDDINDNTKFPGETSFATNPNNVAQNYDNSEQHEEDSDYKTFSRTTSPENEHYYYNGGSSFNRPQGLNDADFSTGVSLSRDNYGNNGGDSNGFQPQGMSDTRHLENGKYFYDVNTGKYSNNHPYERIRARNNANINMNSYGNTGNAYRFNNGNQDQYMESYLH